MHNMDESQNYVEQKELDIKENITHFSLYRVVERTKLTYDVKIRIEISLGCDA